jgi:hypothetical protein
MVMVLASVEKSEKLLERHKRDHQKSHLLEGGRIYLSLAENSSYRKPVSFSQYGMHN